MLEMKQNMLKMSNHDNLKGIGINKREQLAERQFNHKNVQRLENGLQGAMFLYKV